MAKSILIALCVIAAVARYNLASGDEFAWQYLRFQGSTADCKAKAAEVATGFPTANVDADLVTGFVLNNVDGGSVHAAVICQPEHGVVLIIVHAENVATAAKFRDRLVSDWE